MKYERFEDLPAWRASAELAVQVFHWTSSLSFRNTGDLGSQLQRAALSVSNNIAEGFERGTTNELITFLYYARGSAGEVRSMLCVMERMDSYAGFKFQISNLKSMSESISRQIRGWTNSLQNSQIEGQRHLNDQERKAFESRRRSQTFTERQRQWRSEMEARLSQQAHQRGTKQEDTGE